MIEEYRSRQALLKEEEPRKIILDVIFVFLIILFTANIVIQTYWLSPVKVSGDSMQKTLSDGDWLYISKIKEPEVGDVVVFAKSAEVNYIKRIIALEGDAVRSKDGVVYVRKNGKTEWEKYTDENAYYNREPYGTYLDYSLRDIPVTKVGKGEMFVLGDNRWDSKDSRDIGLVKTSSILGVVPNWAIENKDSYGGYLSFVEKVSFWFAKLKERISI